MAKPFPNANLTVMFWSSVELSNAVCSSEIHWLLGNGISLCKKVFFALAGDRGVSPFRGEVGNTVSLQEVWWHVFSGIGEEKCFGVLLWVYSCKLSLTRSFLYLQVILSLFAQIWKMSSDQLILPAVLQKHVLKQSFELKCEKWPLKKLG